MTTLTELEFVRFLISDSLERLRVASPDHLKNPHKNRKSNSRKITKFLDIHRSINQRPVCAAFLVTIPSKQGSHSYAKWRDKAPTILSLNPFKTGKSFLHKLKLAKEEGSKSQSLQNREVIPTALAEEIGTTQGSQSLQNREVIPTRTFIYVSSLLRSQSLQNREVIPTYQTAPNHSNIKSQSLQNREVIPTRIFDEAWRVLRSQSLQNREVIPTCSVSNVSAGVLSQSLQNREVIPTDPDQNL